MSRQSGGPSQAILPMCRALRDKGVDVLLATTDSGINGSPALERITSYQGLPVIFFRKQLGASFKYSRPFSLWLDKNVASYDLLHIHAVFNHACIAAARASRVNRVPYIVRPLGTLDPWSMRQKSLRKGVFWHAGIKRMLTKAAGIHYTAKGEQETVEQSLKLNHGIVVPLGIETRATERPKAETDSSGQFGWLREHPYILVLSRLLPTKGLDILLDAFLSLIKCKEFQSWRLVLAGEGPAGYVESLKRRASELRAGDRVVFPGWLDGEKKEAALMNASLLALPSHHENFGLCVMESLAYGVPVLISPHVNLAPDVEIAGAGWVAAVRRDSLEAALAEALGSARERQKRGEAGRNLALNFAWPVIAGRLCDAYRTVLAAKN
ncbi:MAG: glycosyltransferase [Pyrinomonadaceae bacterium]|nr:glycosyltransferase [Pyrinomonadaceae bacterium]